MITAVADRTEYRESCGYQR